MRFPAWSDRNASLPFSGSTPITRIPGRRCLAAMEQPDISPPPPMGATNASRSGTSSRSSSAVVPCPAMIQG